MDKLQRAWMRRVGLLVLLLPVLAAATIYKSKGSDGRIIYSDKPMMNGEAVKLPTLTRYRGGVIGQSGSQSAHTQQVARRHYQSLRIAAPRSGQTFQNLGGRLDVTLRLYPELHPLDVVVIMLDGHKVKVIGASELQAAANKNSALAGSGEIAATLDGIWRGEHVLSAQVENAAGGVRIKSSAVTIFVQQASKSQKSKNSSKPLLAPTFSPPAATPAKGTAPAARSLGAS